MLTVLHAFQADLARIFAKSRMTISKLLRPESVAKVHALAASGVRLEAKRCKAAQYPVLEEHLFMTVGRGTRTVTKSEIIQEAEKLACEMMIHDLDVGNNWYTRFVNQHDLVVQTPARLESRYQTHRNDLSTSTSRRSSQSSQSGASTVSTMPSTPTSEANKFSEPLDLIN